MEQFHHLQHVASDEFLRDVGISLEQFRDLHQRLVLFHQERRERHPMRKRGKKPVTLSTEDKLLLTCYYLRHYRTFAQLGRQFGIHESYACKVYHAHLDAIVKV